MQNSLNSLIANKLLIIGDDGLYYPAEKLALFINNRRIAEVELMHDSGHVYFADCIDANDCLVLGLDSTFEYR